MVLKQLSRREAIVSARSCAQMDKLGMLRQVDSTCLLKLSRIACQPPRWRSTELVASGSNTSTILVRARGDEIHGGLAAFELGIENVADDEGEPDGETHRGSRREVAGLDAMDEHLQAIRK